MPGETFAEHEHAFRTRDRHVQQPFLFLELLVALLVLCREHQGVRQRFAVQPVGSAGENAPAIAEEGAIRVAARRLGGEIRHYHDVEFETFRLMYGQHSNHVVVLADDLGFGFVHRIVLSPLAKVAHDAELDEPRRRDELSRITMGYSPAMIEQVCSLALTYSHHQGRAAFVWDDIVEAMTTLESGTAIGIDYVADETRAVVSEPLGDLPGAWNEAPESHVGIVRPGEDELRPFSPSPAD